MSKIFGASTIKNLTVRDRLNLQIQHATPATGTTVIATGPILIIEPSAALATLTLKFPTGSSGQVFKFVSSQDITALTVENATIAGGAPTALTAGVSKCYIFYNSKWWVMG